MKALVLPADIQALIAFCKSSVIGVPIPQASVNSMGQVVMPGATPQLPPYPARPTDPVLAAFYDDMVVPLYNAAYAMGQAFAAAVQAPAQAAAAAQARAYDPSLPPTPAEIALAYSTPPATPDGGGF
jgi:hypothetical protein